jgi:Protein phosphatase 2C
MLKVNVSATQGAGPANEDVAGHCGDAAWVVDGATGVGEPLLSGPSDAAWFANCVNSVLGDILRDRPSIATRNLLVETISTCAAAFECAALRTPTDVAELPSAAFAMVRQFGNSIEFTTLGDCRIAYRATDGSSTLFGGTALGPFEGRSIALAHALRLANPAIDPAALKEALLPHLRETRRLMNRPGGYWILGTNPAAADHVDRMVLEAKQGDSFALASDGFLRLVELFEIADAADLLAIGSQQHFEAQLARLRALESEPGSVTKHPRIKRHDDVSFVQCDYWVEG